MSEASTHPAGTATPGCVFEAAGLKKDFDDGAVKALRGVDFRIAPGEFVAVIGPSGCGKTTLLQMLGALDRPSAGSLLYRGKSLAEIREPATYRAREIGFVFQAFHLLPTFTAVENVQIPMFETDRPVAERKTCAIELLRSVGLDQRGGHFCERRTDGDVIPCELVEIRAQRARFGRTHPGAHARAPRSGGDGAQSLLRPVGQCDGHVIPMLARARRRCGAVPMGR